MIRDIQLDEYENKLCEIAIELKKLIGSEKALEIISKIHLYYLKNKYENKNEDDNPETNLNIMEAGL